MTYESGHDANGLAAIARALAQTSASASASASASTPASAPAVAQAADGVTLKKSKAQQEPERRKAKKDKAEKRAKREKRREHEAAEAPAEEEAPASNKRGKRKKARLAAAASSDEETAPSPSTPSTARAHRQPAEGIIRSGRSDAARETIDAVERLLSSVQAAAGVPFVDAEAMAAVAAAGPAAEEWLYDTCGTLGASTAATLLRVLGVNSELLAAGGREQRGGGGGGGGGVGGLADELRVDPTLPTATAYVETKLWSSVVRHNASVWGHMRAVLKQREREGQAETAEVAGGTDATKATDEARRTFKSLYMRSFTEAFGEELNRLREGDGDGDGGGDSGGSGGGVRVDFLVQCIEAGVDLFADVQQQLVVRALQPPPQQHRVRPAQAAACL